MKTILHRLLMEIKFAWLILRLPKHSGGRHVLKTYRNCCRSLYSDIKVDFYK